MELIATPLRQRQRGFVLTSLIDVIFLLLVFFMLSSQIAPYSLLTVSGAESRQESDAPKTTPLAQAAVTTQMMFVVSRGHVRAGSATIPLDQLPAALKRLQNDTQLNATVLTTRSATVQDVVTALEMFETARVASVRLLMAPS